MRICSEGESDGTCERAFQIFVLTKQVRQRQVVVTPARARDSRRADGQFTQHLACRRGFEFRWNDMQRDPGAAAPGDSHHGGIQRMEPTEPENAAIDFEPARLMGGVPGVDVERDPSHRSAQLPLDQRDQFRQLDRSIAAPWPPGADRRSATSTWRPDEPGVSGRQPSWPGRCPVVVQASGVTLRDRHHGDFVIEPLKQIHPRVNVAARVAAQ